MPCIPHLTIVVPGVIAALQSAYERSDAIPQLPGLEALLRSSEPTQAWAPDDLNFARLDPWQAALLLALGSDCYTCGLASATLSWRGAGQALSDGTYLHLEPVHLTAGMDRLHLFNLSVEQSAREQLCESLRAPLAGFGFELQLGPDGDWFAYSSSQLDLVTYSPRSRFNNHVYEIMPSGADAAALRRLMTEVQMLWHAHPINVQRERRGESLVSGVWPWGAGRPQRGVLSDPPHVLSSSSYVRGLSEYLQFNCAPLPSANDLLSSTAHKIIVVLEEETLHELDERWLLAILRAWQGGHINQLDLRLDHWRLTLHGGSWHRMKRIFRKTDHMLSELLA